MLSKWAAPWLCLGRADLARSLWFSGHRGGRWEPGRRWSKERAAIDRIRSVTGACGPSARL